MTVLILHTLPPVHTEPGRTADEFDLSAAAAGLAEVLPDAAIAAVRGQAREILALLKHHRPDIVFNACEAPLGRPDLEAHVPALLEWLNVRFTGCGSETIALCRRKDRASAVLAAAGIPIPRTGVFPCIVKPADEDGSAHIGPDCICHNESDIAKARARIPGPLIVQEFLPGREFAVSLWGRNSPECSAVGETLFQNGLQLITYTAKWHTDSPDFADSPLSYTTEIAPELRGNILDAARAAWHAVGARHYLRIDLRLDSAGQPRILDINPNPELGPQVGICRAVTEAGWTRERFIHQLIEWA